MATKLPDASWIKVTPSQAGSLFECPRCSWLYYREGLKKPAGIFPSLPGGFDALFKKYFDDFRVRKELPPELHNLEGVTLFEDRGLLDGWRNNRRGLLTEFPDIKVVLNGAIDELLINKNGEFIVLDFKTRGWPLKEDTHTHYQTQLDLYALLFEKNGYKVSKDGYLLFFWPKAYGGHNAEFQTELVRLPLSSVDGLGVLQRLRELVDGKEPESHEECEFCRFRNFEQGD